MAATSIQPLGNGQYVIKVNGQTFHVSGQTPGSVITVGGKKVTLPGNTPAPAAPATYGTYHPGTPFLTPDQQLEFNRALDNANSTQVDLAAGIQQAHTNYERTIADLAHNALVQAQSVEENMAARGQFNSGIRSSALTDVEQHRALAATRADQDLRAADILYETKNSAVNTSRGQLADWYTTTAGKNASESSYITPGAPASPAAGVKQPAAPAKPPPAPTFHAITPGQKALASGGAFAPTGGKSKLAPFQTVRR